MQILAAALPDLGNLTSILKMVFGFGLVIFIHELGHFLFAKLHGVKVEKFAIGFDFGGHKFFSWNSGGTEYVIGAYPIGGYVKMLGHNEASAEIEESRDPDSFQSKSVFARVQIISAGVLFNFLSAFLLCFLALVLGYHRYPPVVGAVHYGALEAGLRPGDVVQRVAGKDVGSWEDLFVQYATLEPGSETSLVVERDGETLRLVVPVHRDPEQPFNVPDFGRPVIPQVSHVVVDSAADEAGVEPGDKLLAVDEHEVSSWSGFSDLIRRRADVDATVTIAREDDDGEWVERVLPIHPRSRRPDLVPKKVLGVEPDMPARIDLVVPGSTGEAAGLQAGDVIVQLAGHPIHSWYAAWRQVTWLLPEGEPVQMTVLRGPGELRLSVPQAETPDWSLGTHALPSMGLAGEAADQLVLRAPELGGAAARSGLQAGDVVLRFEAKVDVYDGSDTWTMDDPNWESLLIALNSMQSEIITLDLLRGGERLSAELKPDDASDGVAIGFLGVGPRAYEIVRQLGPIEALLPAIKEPFAILESFVRSIQAMFLQRISARVISGPVGILQATYSYASRRTGDLLNFLALLSVNLAIVNFLPIPVTDGGHFVFLMYEKMKGQRMDEELEARFQWAGLVLILMLFLFATFNDVGRLLGF